MKDCVKDVTIASEMPEFARNQHGNLAQQKRPLGPHARHRYGAIRRWQDSDRRSRDVAGRGVASVGPHRAPCMHGLSWDHEQDHRPGFQRNRD